MTSNYNRLHFQVPSSREERANLFATSVSNVVIEITSYCNRKCGYCPVSTVDRTDTDKNLPEDLYRKIIDDLATISYEKGICLNLYNEPTADTALLLERIRYARRILPASRIYFSTNGDYLTADYIKAMVDAGLSSMEVTLHLPANAPYSDSQAVTRFCDLSKRVGKAVEVTHVSSGHTIEGNLNLFGLPIHVFSTNYDLYGSDRAGSVTLLQKQVARMAPCDRPFNDFTVSYDGTIFPCCQMFADSAEHSREYSIGNLKNFPDIFAAYASSAMVEWRKHLLTYGPKARPCDTCSENNRAGTREEHLERERMYRQFVGPIQARSLVAQMTSMLRHILVKTRA